MTVIKKDTVDSFYQKWGIGVPARIDFKAFQLRILDCVKEDLIPISQDRMFKASYARITGIRRLELDKMRSEYVSSDSPAPAVALIPEFLSSLVEKTEALPMLMHNLQLLLWSLLDSGRRQIAEKFAGHLATIFMFTPGIAIDIIISEDIMIYPSGAKLLDDKAVKETVDWLVQYPEVGKHFFESLKIYAGKEVTRYRHLLDNLRFSLEQMLRAVLGNQKSLENQKEEALRWLASHKIHAHIVNMYNDLITKFASYQNDAVKHNEKYSPAEIEFMIYMTGTFLRFLVQLHTGQTAPALAVKTP